MSKYKCYNCEKISSLYIKDIIKHLSVHKKCEKATKSIIYSNDQIFILSLFPEGSIDEKEIEKFKNSCFLYDNKENIFSIINKINVNRQKHCHLCEKKFKTRVELKKHILFECFEESNKKKNKNNSLSNTTNIENSSITNIHGNNGTIYNDSNVTINNNINIELKCPISFSHDWDTSHIDYKTLNNVLISNHLMMMYLEEILKNENNLNVILNNNDIEGLVFDEKEYVKMKKEEITDKTIDKINNDLNKLLEDYERNEKIVKKYLDDIRERIEKKIRILMHEM
jgi:hypothetical protein